MDERTVLYEKISQMNKIWNDISQIVFFDTAAGIAVDKRDFNKLVIAIEDGDF